MGDRAVDPFDVITRVNQAQVPRDALPTGAIEPVIVVEQAPASDDLAIPAEPGVIVDPSVADPVVAVDPELSAKLTERMPELPDPALKTDAAQPPPSPAAEPAPASALSSPAVEPAPSPPMEASDVREAGAAPVAAAASASTEDADRAPNAVFSFGAALTDRIARMRGLRPITRPPYDDDDDGRGRRGRGGFYLALVVSIASLVVSASVVMWARGEVRRARSAQSPPPPPLAKLVADASTVAASTTTSRAAASATATTTEAPTPPGCFVRVTSNIDDAVVWIDGARRGEAPTEVPVVCGERATIEVRRLRYREFKSAVVVPEGTVVIDARLERKRR